MGSIPPLVSNTNSYTWELHLHFRISVLLYFTQPTSLVLTMARKITKEEGCFDVTFERKFYQRDRSVIKRSLRTKEYGEGADGPHIPRLSMMRLQNEAATLEFIRKHTNIPVPLVFCHFEDDGAYYLITEHIPGTPMCDLKEEQKILVYPELERTQAALKRIQSNRLGGPSGLVVPPYRVLRRSERDSWIPRPAPAGTRYTFCHNDLTQSNIIVDPETYKINGIIDWEYAGFYPESFEFPFYKRLGPSAAINNERDDSYQMLDFLTANVRIRVLPARFRTLSPQTEIIKRRDTDSEIAI